jgi:predicted ATPase/class 3 adenylate cyclase
MTPIDRAGPETPPTGTVTFLFTDIEGSTRLWEQEPERMRPALARHDAIARSAVEDNRGAVVKMSGDGIHAAFTDPLDALGAALQLQQALVDPEVTDGIALRVRCGLHTGVAERRDNDYFGSTVNRAARVMSVAHGGQVLVTQAVASLVSDRLPAGIVLRDLGAVRLRDLASPEYVFQIVHPRLRPDFPALRSLEATPNNLSQQVTSFIGRERALAEVKNLLGRARLVTLLGVGGLGKTRLSLQVGADTLDEYPDGVWFVELAPLADPRLVPQAVASVLGVKEEAGRPVDEALVKFVQNRQLLLILDNCEHLTHASAELATRLLQAGARLKILASSREPLRAAGEMSYLVPALSVPDPGKSLTVAALTQYEAVRLFVDRAVAVQSAFRMTAQNGAAVADICHRLDGIPLAIELAAARVRSLSVETIAARLSDRFRLLTRGDRTALPRQQTLRALIDWSYDLLTEHERTLLRRLAVFAGGWTLEGAEHVGAGGEVDEAAVLDLLGKLVEKSLVELEIEGERYRLLETIREYAKQRLDESNEGGAVRTRHLAFYLALAEKVNPELMGPEQGACLARLDLERENFIAAHAWCGHAEGGGELGLRLVHAVKLYLVNRGLLGLVRQEAMEALARPGAQERSLARCRVLFAAGQVDFFMGQYGEAMKYLEESRAIAQEIGDKGRAATVLQVLGMVAVGQEDRATARRYFEEALGLVRELGNRRELGAALTALAQLDRVEGELDAADTLYWQVLELARALGDREMIAISLLNLAMVSIGRGAADCARGMLLEVLDIAEEIGSRRTGESLLEVTAGLAASGGEFERVALFFGAAEALTDQTGLHRDPADEAFLAPRVAQARRTLGEAAFAATAATGRALSYEDALRKARAWLGNAERNDGRSS